MKKTLFVLAASLLLPLSVTVQAAESEDTEITKSMERMASSYRTARRLAPNPANNARTTQSLETIRTQALEAKKHIPLRAAEVPEAARAKFVEEYQKQMDAFVAVVDKALVALKANDNPTVVALIAEMADIQEKGHKEFQIEEKE